MKRMDKTEEKLLAIGGVADSFGVSDNTIRRMEAAGLITPALVKDNSGYRYYDTENLIAIAGIMNLKDFGFTYEEIHKGLCEPNGMEFLYEQLLAKRAGIDLMINKLGRRVPAHGTFRVAVTETPDMYAYVLTDRIAPTVRAATGLEKHALYLAVHSRCPIDYSLPVTLTCEENDLRTVLSKKALSVSACVPLRGEHKADDVVLIPGVKAVSFTFDREYGSIEDVLGEMERVMTERGYKQNGPVRAIIEAADTRSEKRAAGGSTVHVLIPIE